MTARRSKRIQPSINTLRLGSGSIGFDCAAGCRGWGWTGVCNLGVVSRRVADRRTSFTCYSRTIDLVTCILRLRAAGLGKGNPLYSSLCFYSSYSLSAPLASDRPSEIHAGPLWPRNHLLPLDVVRHSFLSWSCFFFHALRKASSSWLLG